jgi:hypothetical protein
MRLPLALTAAIVTALAGVLAGPAPASATQPKPLMVGAAEDAAKEGGALEAEAKMSLARIAGFDTIRVTSIWHPGQKAIAGGELSTLQAVADAASLNGIRLIVSVYPFGSKTVPQYATTRAQFAAYAASIPLLVPSVGYVIVGNEPNLNRFWMPQFTKNGLDAAASSYLGLLAQIYDAIKQASPQTIDRRVARPSRQRQPGAPAAHAFASPVHPRHGRRLPAQRPEEAGDGLVFDPPVPRASGLPPTFAHPKGTDHLDRRLREARPTCSGRRSTGPQRENRSCRSSTTSSASRRERRTASASSMQTRPFRPRRTRSAKRSGAATTPRRWSLAACQKNVVGLLFFHVSDEADLDRWQSGVYYADDTPKTDLPVVKTAALAARAGTLVKSCS